jgi:autotransporter adhesin
MQANIATNGSGIAGAMAMAQLSEAGPGEKLVISVGGGTWEGSAAAAAGLSGRLTERVSLRGAASVGNGNPGVSVAMGWRLK